MTKCIAPAKTKNGPNRRARVMRWSLWRGWTRPRRSPTSVRRGRPPLLLAPRLALLRLRVASSGGRRRTRRPAPSRRRERGGETLSQSLQRELAVARLAARVLRDRRHARSDARDRTRLLRLAEHLRGGDVEIGRAHV